MLGGSADSASDGQPHENVVSDDGKDLDSKLPAPDSFEDTKRTVVPESLKPDEATLNSDSVVSDDDYADSQEDAKPAVNNADTRGARNESLKDAKPTLDAAGKIAEVQIPEAELRALINAEDNAVLASKDESGNNNNR